MTAVTPPPVSLTPPPPPPPPSIPTPHPAAAPWPSEHDGHDPELTAAVSDFAPQTDIPTSGSFENEEQLPPLPPQIAPPPPAGAAALGAQEWKKLAKAEVNPKWFWRVVVGVAAFAIVLIGLFALFARSAAKPSVTPDAALEQEVRETRQALGEGQKLFGRRQVRGEPREVPPGPRAQPQQPGSSQVRADGRERRQEPAGGAGAARAGRRHRHRGADRSDRGPLRRRQVEGGRGPRPRRDQHGSPGRPRARPTPRSPRPRWPPRPRLERRACGRHRSRDGGMRPRRRPRPPASPRRLRSRAPRPRPFRETPACGSSSTLRSTRATSWSRSTTRSFSAGPSPSRRPRAAASSAASPSPPAPRPSRPGSRAPGIPAAVFAHDDRADRRRRDADAPAGLLGREARASSSSRAAVRSRGAAPFAKCPGIAYKAQLPGA